MPIYAFVAQASVVYLEVKSRYVFPSVLLVEQIIFRPSGSGECLDKTKIGEQNVGNEIDGF